MAWNDVQSVLEGYGEDSHDETVAGESWRTVHAFAVHYMRLLEIHSCEPDAGRLAALAWWMTERVTQVMGETALGNFGPEKTGPFLRRFMQNA